MFIPLHDNTPLKVIRFQYVTLMIIIANIAIYIFTGATQSEYYLAAVATGFGVVPVELLQVIAPPTSFSPIAEPLTLVTYMFLHGSWEHLLSNMIFLWVLADNIEDAFGYVAFAMFYLLCGILGALAHVMMSSDSLAPLIGASAAVSGVIGAYLLLYPRARVWVLIFPIPLRISAFWVLGFWFVLQIYSVLTAAEGADIEVAFWAHIGGFLAGLFLTILLRSRLLIRT
jgi:membrane associated rhomboid family serine protease